jgi:hypothetical protein
MRSTFQDACVKNSIVQPEALEALGLILSLWAALLTFPNQVSGGPASPYSGAVLD